MIMEMALPKNTISDWLRKHADLFKNTGAVTIGTGVASILAFVYWWIAAKSLPPDVIGKASALIYLMGMVGLLGDAGIGTLLNGEIATWRSRSVGMVSAALIYGGGTALLAGAVVIWGLGRFLHPTMVDGVLFVIGCCLTAAAAVCDQSLTWMLRAGTRMVRQFAFSGLRVGLLLLALTWAIDESASILLSWIVSLFLTLIHGEILMRRFGASLVGRPDFQLLYQLRDKAANHYLLDLGTQAPGMIMPYLVAVLQSPSTNAVFTVIWMIFSVASVVPGAFATLLFPIIRADPKQYRDKMILSLSMSLAFAVGFGILIYLFSTQILTLFNPAYGPIENGQLCLIGFGMLGAVIKFHVCAAARLANEMRRASSWFFVGGLLEIMGTIIGSKMGGLMGVSIGWTMAILFEAGLMLLLANPCRDRRII